MTIAVTLTNAATGEERYQELTFAADPNFTQFLKELRRQVPDRNWELVESWTLCKHLEGISHAA